jgi:hypothetical protein
MPAIAIIGAGPGLGAATARRFGREGFGIALIARTPDKLDRLREELAVHGIEAGGYTADVQDADALRRALAAAASELGPIEVLQYSPVPRKEFLRPVLETTTGDLAAATAFSILGPVAAVQQVLPGMSRLGRGTIIAVPLWRGARPCRLWGAHDVRTHGTGTKRFDHPDAGESGSSHRATDRTPDHDDGGAQSEIPVNPLVYSPAVPAWVGRHRDMPCLGKPPWYIDRDPHARGES